MRVNGHAAAGALTPATATTTAPVEAPNTTHGQHNSPPMALVPAHDDAVARFMPLMAIEQAIRRREAIVDATKALMADGVDFGKIPGAGDRLTLLQPGADKLCNLFGLVIQYEVVKSEEDWTGEKHGGTPFFFYEVKGRAFRGDFLMGEGIGSCSSWESKYRWRKAERTCPSCGAAAIIKGRAEYGGGWLCFKKKEGCGATFGDNDQAIVAQEVGRKPNPDMADVVNTVLKMAYKRCKVSTTINATSASEFFTQDVEEEAAGDEGDRRPAAAPAAHAHAPSSAPPTPMRAQTSVPAGEPFPADPTRGTVKRLFAAARERVGEVDYLTVLARFGVTTPEALKSVEQAREAYALLCAIRGKAVA